MSKQDDVSAAIALIKAPILGGPSGNDQYDYPISTPGRMKNKYVPFNALMFLPFNVYLII